MPRCCRSPRTPPDASRVGRPGASARCDTSTPLRFASACPGRGCSPRSTRCSRTTSRRRCGRSHPIDVPGEPTASLLLMPAWRLRPAHRRQARHRVSGQHHARRARRRRRVRAFRRAQRQGARVVRRRRDHRLPHRRSLGVRREPARPQGCAASRAGRIGADRTPAGRSPSLCPADRARERMESHTGARARCRRRHEARRA